MTEEHPAACAECGSDLQPRDKFCPECGHKIPMVEVLSDDTEVIEGRNSTATAEAIPQTLLVGAMVTLGLILAGAAWWGLTQNPKPRTSTRRRDRCSWHRWTTCPGRSPPRWCAISPVMRMPNSPRSTSPSTSDPEAWSGPDSRFCATPSPRWPYRRTSRTTPRSGRTTVRRWPTAWTRCRATVA